MANKILFLFVVGFWLFLVAAMKLDNWRRGRSWSSGPSLIPVIPFFPALALAVGWALNLICSPWGTVLAIGFHCGLVGFAFAGSFSTRAHSSDSIYHEARRCADLLGAEGHAREAEELRRALYGSTSGEVLTFLGAGLSSALQLKAGP
jgi:hypothetical protein